jgi:transposase
MWIATSDLSSPGHPFYQRLNHVLAEAGFDRHVDDSFAPFYSEGKGRPGIPPGTCMRTPPVGYFEGTDSERGIA